MKGWIVCQQFGKTSESWLWRQAVAMERLQPRIVTFARMHPEESPFPEERVSVLPFPQRPWELKWGRWPHRARNLAGRNFYASVGAERRALERLLEEQRPDVILAHFGHMSMRVLPSARRFGVPVVAYLHGLVFQSYERNRWARFSLRRSARDFAEILVVGSHQLTWFEERDIRAPKPVLLPCGAPTDEFTPKPADEHGEVRFLAVSRLMPQKGLLESLRAFQKVRAELPGCRFDVVGDGPQRALLEGAIADLGLGSCATLHGRIPPDDHMRLVRGAHVFVQHSLQLNGWLEGFGVSITEASCCEIPVVATRTGGIGDQIVDGENGYLVEPGDVDAMAAAMLRLARDPSLRRRMGAAGRERAVRLFDARAQALRLEELLLRTAERHAGRRA
jgi:colanic acid/amylovoran biosynthesis glycosyltransferase